MTLFGRKPRKARRRVDYQAWLVNGREFAIRPCRVVDISDEGAQLKVDINERLPKRFALTFSRATREGRLGELRWRNGETVGVKFVTDESAR